MKQDDLPRDFNEKHAWLHLQQELLDAGPDEIDVELDHIEERGYAPFRLIIKMNDSRSRHLDVLFRADGKGFALADFRLQRLRGTDSTDVLDVCKSWMYGTENVKSWMKFAKRLGR